MGKVGPTGSSAQAKPEAHDDLVDELRLLYAQERRRSERLLAVNQVVQKISATLDLEGTLDAIVGAAAELVPCSLAEISLWDEGRRLLVLQALRCEPERAFPIGQSFPPGEGYTGWIVRQRQPLLVPDVDARQDIRPDLLPGERPFKAYVGLPLLTDDKLIGTLVLVHDKAGAFGEEDLQVLQTLAGHATTAIRNARLYEEVAALYTVAEAVNRPLDLDELLQQALDRVIDVTHAQGGGIRLIDPSTEELFLAAHRGLSETYIREAARFPQAQEIVGWVARTARSTISDDMWVDERVSPEVRALLREVGHRSLAQVPLRAQDRVVGTVGVVAKEPGFFKENDLQLLDAIGQQLGAAIANAQLFEETQRKARRLAALNAVASVINQPLSLQEIMDQAIAKVVQVMETEAGGIRLLEPTRGELVLSASWSQGVEDEDVRMVGRLPLAEQSQEWVSRFHEPVVLSDLEDDPRFAGLTLAIAPVKVKDETVGMLGVSTRRHREFSPEDLNLLQAIGHQLGTAIANARLLEETQRRAQRLAALNAVAAAINQALDLETLLRDAAQRVIQVVGATSGGIRLLDPESNRLNAVFSLGMTPAYAASVKSIRLGQRVAGNVALTGEPALITDLWAQESMPERLRRVLQEEGVRSLAVVPLRAGERVVGTLGVSAPDAGAFGPADLDLLVAIGHQLGVAIENAQLRQQALDAERLAAVGRVASTVAHDLRSPLGGIMRSADFLSRPELSEATRKRLSEAIVAMSRRLSNSAQEILDYTRGGRMQLRLSRCGLPEFLEEVIEVMRIDFSEQGIEVVMEWGFPGVVHMDPDRMAQVVYNIATNARDAMPEGGRFTVTTQEVGEWVELRFRDTGPGVPTELTGHIFEPFVSFGKREGAGLGLAIARRIVEEHGGEISVESPTEGGATFVVRLPLGGAPL